MLYELSILYFIEIYKLCVEIYGFSRDRIMQEVTVQT